MPKTTITIDEAQADYLREVITLDVARRQKQAENLKQMPARQMARVTAEIGLSVLQQLEPPVEDDASAFFDDAGKEPVGAAEEDEGE